MPKLSYANVMATIAVFIALGGSSYAAIQMTGRNVKNGSLTGKDVRDRSLGQRELSNRAVKSLRGKAGPAGPAGVQGPAGAAATSLWAVVNVDGTLRRGSGVVSVSNEGSPANRYAVVKFNRDVSHCAHIVSLAYTRDGHANTGEIAAGRTTAPTEQLDSVTVQGFESGGYSVLTPPVYKDFQLAVFC